MKVFILCIVFFFFIGCSVKNPNKSVSSTVLLKTPTMKYYDRGFINYFDDYVHLQLLNVGTVVLELSIYKEKICKSSLQCIDANEFNGKYLHKSYKNDFLYNLFLQQKIYFKDKENNIFIKVN